MTRQPNRRSSPDGPYCQSGDTLVVGFSTCLAKADGKRLKARLVERLLGVAVGLIYQVRQIVGYQPGG